MTELVLCGDLAASREPQSGRLTVSVEPGSTGSARRDTKSWSLQLWVIYAEASSQKRALRQGLGLMAPCILGTDLGEYVWLEHTWAEHLRSMGRAWERRHECVCGVHLCIPSMVSSGDRCYFPGRAQGLVATTPPPPPCCSSWQRRALAPHSSADVASCPSRQPALPCTAPPPPPVHVRADLLDYWWGGSPPDGWVSGVGWSGEQEGSVEPQPAGRVGWQEAEVPLPLQPGMAKAWQTQARCTPGS